MIHSYNFPMLLDIVIPWSFEYYPFCPFPLLYQPTYGLWLAMHELGLLLN